MCKTNKRKSFSQKPPASQTIAITGGGTMGHISPLLALSSSLKKTYKKVIYLGRANSMEEKMAKKYNIEFYSIDAISFNRKNLISNIKIPYMIHKSTKAVMQIFKKNKVDVLLSKGGFVSVPAVAAAKKCHIPYFIHESDLTLGLANKIAQKHATKIFVSTKQTKDSVPKKFQAKTVVTGIPVDKKFCKNNFLSIKNTYNLPQNAKIILFTGGSQGATTINNAVKNLIGELTKKYFVVLISGKGKTTHISAKNFLEIEFSSVMPELMHRSHIIISRAGATTIFEGLAAEKPMILVPLKKSKYSRGDQEENAIYFSNLKIARVISEDSLETKLMRVINDIENNYTKITSAISAYNKSHKQTNIIEEMTK